MIANLQRYKIHKHIGQGDMADVYEAYDPRIDRVLAIKLLREERCSDSEYRARFLRESKAAGNLTHPNIVTVYDVGESGQRPYMVMELLKGVPLNVFMENHPPLMVGDIVKIGIQLADALHYAHSKGIVHRDIKPSNIVIDPDDYSVKITDFGIAHFVNTEFTQNTRKGDVLGTPRYMSPEQVEGKKLDGRSDLFSVGVVLYQLLTGERPFNGDTITTLMYQITHTNPKTIAQLNKNVPVSVGQVIERLLSKNPQTRYQSGQELQRALLSALDSAHGRDKSFMIPIRVKWSLIMSTIVSLVMIASIIFIFERQYRAMSNQMFEFGDSLVKFVAIETAVPVLSEDWTSVELLVVESSQRQNFNYLVVVDHEGIVRGATNAEQIGRPYDKSNTIGFNDKVNLLKLVNQVINREFDVIDFSAPIQFQGKKIGETHLGISQESMLKLAELTMVMMAALVLITISVVVIFSYALGRYFTSAINLVHKALNEISMGHFSYRIDKKRRDEFGLAYDAFDRMAEFVQQVNQRAKRMQTRTQKIANPSSSAQDVDDSTRIRPPSSGDETRVFEKV